MSSRALFILCFCFAIMAPSQTDQGQGNTKPHKNEKQVRHGESGEIKDQFRSYEDQQRRQGIACATKETFNGRLRLVFGVAAGVQEQSMTGGVLKGIIRTVFSNLRGSNETQYRNKS